MSVTPTVKSVCKFALHEPTTAPNPHTSTFVKEVDHVIDVELTHRTPVDKYAVVFVDLRHPLATQFARMRRQPEGSHWDHSMVLNGTVGLTSTSDKPIKECLDARTPCEDLLVAGMWPTGDGEKNPGLWMKAHTGEGGDAQWVHTAAAVDRPRESAAKRPLSVPIFRTAVMDMMEKLGTAHGCIVWTENELGLSFSNVQLVASQLKMQAINGTSDPAEHAYFAPDVFTGGLPTANMVVEGAMKALAAARCSSHLTPLPLHPDKDLHSASHAFQAGALVDAVLLCEALNRYTLRESGGEATIVLSAALSAFPNDFLKRQTLSDVCKFVMGLSPGIKGPVSAYVVSKLSK